MVHVDLNKCRKCNVCIERFEGYCISTLDGYPKIDYSLCNQCQKCISICPHQAILMNNIKPAKIKAPLTLSSDDLKEVLQRRRSIKKFKNKQIPKQILLDIASVGKYAPNQNKNIDIIIINDSVLIHKIDTEALKIFSKLYKLLFSFKGLTAFFKLFAKSLDVIKKKMEYDIKMRKKIMKENTQAFYLAIGNPRVPVTKESAHYILSNMHIYASSLGIGSCLMDSIKMALNSSKKLRKALHLPKKTKVLGVLAVGYPDEKIINIPIGYSMNIYWNDYSLDNTQ